MPTRQKGGVDRKKEQLATQFQCWGIDAWLDSSIKFICSKLIPTTHTSHVTLDRVTLHYAMIKIKKDDVGWIIFNNILESYNPTKGLWFPSIITKLCT